MKAMPVAVRERIIRLYKRGRKTGDISSSVGYCAAAVRRVRQNFKRRGTLTPQTHLCGRKTLLTSARQARLRALLREDPGATLAKLGSRLKRPVSTISLWLKRMGMSEKRNAARLRAAAARHVRAKKAAAGAGGKLARRRKGGLKARR